MTIINKIYKNRIMIYLFITFLMLANVGCTDDTEISGKNILLMMSKGYGVNYYMNGDVFEKYGWNLIRTGISDTIPACEAYAVPYGALTVKSDILISEITDINDYDGVIIMAATQYTSADPYAEFLESPIVIDLVKSIVANNIPLLVYCAGVRVLAAADVIKGMNVVGSPKFQAEYEAAGAKFLGNHQPPSIEGNIITAAKGMYNNAINTQALATVLESKESKNISINKIKTNFIASDCEAFKDSSIIWAKTYGGISSEGGRALCETSDGGYIIVGYTFSHGSDNSDILVIKTDSNGNTIWSKTFGGAGTEYGYGCIRADDGYLLVGYTTSFGAGSKDVYALKIDNDGNEIWSNTYGGTSWDVANFIGKAENGNFIICGHTHSFGAGEDDAYIIKIDSKGKELWSKTFGGKRSEIANSFHVTDEGDYLIAGASGSIEGMNSEIYLIKTDNEGNEIWSNYFHAKGEPAKRIYDWANFIGQDKNGDYFLSGHSSCNDLLDAFVIKVDSDGNQIWANTYGNKPFYDYGNSICMNNNGGMIICGTSKSTDGNNDIFIAEIDSNGNLIQQKCIGGTGSDRGSVIYSVQDDFYVILGQTNSSGAGNFDTYLMKIKL